MLRVTAVPGRHGPDRCSGPCHRVLRRAETAEPPERAMQRRPGPERSATARTHAGMAAATAGTDRR